MATKLEGILTDSGTARPMPCPALNSIQHKKITQQETIQTAHKSPLDELLAV